jgi:hypothetical protein
LPVFSHLLAIQKLSHAHGHLRPDTHEIEHSQSTFSITASETFCRSPLSPDYSIRHPQRTPDYSTLFAFIRLRTSRRSNHHRARMAQHCPPPNAAFDHVRPPDATRFFSPLSARGLRPSSRWSLGG